MQQDTKNSQNTKVDKNIVKAKGKAIGNLMDQIGGDDDDDIEQNNSFNNNNRYNSNNKNNNSYFNYDNTQGYVPEYSKRKIEANNNTDLNINNDNNIDIDNDNDADLKIPSPKNKPQVIKREKKVTKEEKDSNNNTLH